MTDFEQIVENFSADLKRYCRMLTGIPWDGDDLVQETLLKALEALVYELPPRQAAVFLLVDTFAYTASETGLMLDMTEGAVRSSLNRARSRLSQIRQASANKTKRELSQNLDQLIAAFLEAFRKNDPKRVGRAYHMLANTGFRVNRVREGEFICFIFEDLAGNKFTVIAQ